tara:strand:- start:8242 stop:8844 length:603 start_codon:yes stop_codon:yes gene_type:complete
MEKRNSDLSLIFSTPLWTTIVPNYEEINKNMNQYIEKLKKIDSKGKFKSNLIGWHSQNFNLQDPEPQFFINGISKILNESMNDMGWDLNKNKLKITGMWTIINPTNASNSRHIHSNNYISAAYYLKAPENCGDIMFYDPRSAKVIKTPILVNSNQLNMEVVNVTPKEGLLVLFPSYLHHSVGINKSNEDRIVISFNVDLI